MSEHIKVYNSYLDGNMDTCWKVSTLRPWHWGRNGPPTEQDIARFKQEAVQKVLAIAQQDENVKIEDLHVREETCHDKKLIVTVIWRPKKEKKASDGKFE